MIPMIPNVQTENYNETVLIPILQDKVYELTNQTILLQAKLHTWDPVSIELIHEPFNVFQNLIHRSAVPPPLASRPCWWGDQAMAFTAA